VPRATHLVNLDRPNTFNAAVRAFARRVHEQVSAPPPDS
jgi:pimeloyl-ACP methyl ester carboxylesterase